jgi:hypothetical protein
MPLAFAALTLTGAGLSIAGNMKAQSAMKSARAAAAAREDALQQRSEKIFSESLKKSTPQAAQDALAAGEAGRTNAWRDLNNATQPIASALPATTSTATNSASKREGGAAQTWAALNAGNAAKVNAYGDWENQQNIKNAGASQDLSLVDNFARGDARTAATELAVARHAGDALNGWGNIVGLLGSVAGAIKMPGGVKLPKAVTPVGGGWGGVDFTPSNPTAPLNVNGNAFSEALLG